MKRASWDLAGTDDSANEAFNASVRAQALISGFGGLAQGEDVVAEAFDICRGELQLARSGVLRHVAAAVWRGLHPKTSLNLPTRCRVPPQLRPQASSLSHSLPDPERELRLMMPPLPGAESGREPRFPQALVWPWCGLGVALVWLWCGLGGALRWPWWGLEVALTWPWGGFVLRSLCLVYAYNMALGWLWVAFSRLRRSRLRVQGSRFGPQPCESLTHSSSSRPSTTTCSRNPVVRVGDPRFSGGLYCEAAAVAVGGHALGLFGFVQAEEGGVDDFVFVDQCGAGKGFALVAVVGAVADGGELALLGGEDFGQERLGASGDAIRGGRFSLGVESVFAWLRLDKQGLQGVAADQFGMQFDVRRGEGDHVCAGGFAGDERQQADLVWDGFEDFIAFAEVVFPGFVHVAHGRGRRGRAGLRLKRCDAVPDFALVGRRGAARLQGGLDGPRFLGTALVGHDVAGLAERLGGVSPAALLGATHGDFGL